MGFRERRIALKHVLHTQSACQVVQNRFEWHTGPHETWLAAQYVWIDDQDMRESLRYGHASILQEGSFCGEAGRI